MNNGFFKKYSEYEITKYQFENGVKTNKSYINESYDYDRYDFDLIFHCCECHKEYNVKDLTFMNQKIICKCGAKFSKDELKPGVKDWAIKDITYTRHNVNNGTFNKVSVPTLISKEWFYCNNCRTTHKMNDMPIEDKQRVCPHCGINYSFEEIKLVNNNTSDYTNGAIYFDGHMISISYMLYHTSVNRFNKLYWQEGNCRFTMNLETGYSYLTNTGFCYTQFNKLYKKRSGKNAPKMLNSTYMTYSNNTLGIAVEAMISRLFIKYQNNSNLLILMEKKYSLLKAILFNKLIRKIDNYMTDYYNNKYCYRIKSLIELIDEDEDSSHILFNNDKKRGFKLNIYDSFILGLRNRFINASFKDLRDISTDIIYNIQLNSKKRNYKVLPRESNNIALDYICNSTQVSKRLRKRINQDLMNNHKNHLDEDFHIFVNITKHFKNKENVNKVYHTIMNKPDNIYYLYNLSETTMKLWLTYRNELYISNCNCFELDNKSKLMDDARRLIFSIRDVYGNDWDINSVKFYNEQQFHDDLMRITNSEDFIEIINKKKNAKTLEPFKMEDEVFELEEIENDFYIAKNRAILTNIGQAMGICVGGYGGSVESGMCRIAYLKEDGIYKACIELSKHKNPNTKKMEYTIVQAKLQYNKLVAEDEIYYNKVLEWATRNNISIDTNDMHQRIETNQVQELHF